MAQRTIRAAAVLLLLFRAALAWAQPASAPPIDTTLAEIDALIAAAYQKDNIGSVAAGVVVGANLAWSKAYGWADPETKRPASRETLYRIGSVTKQFTALALLQLVEQAKARVTDPLEKYVPEFRQVPTLFPEMQKVTLVQLATMTSGLAREPGGPADHSIGPVAGWEQKVLTALPTLKFAHEPDTRYLYSNIGYALLGMAVGRAAGQPFTTYVQERLVAPLGMSRTGWEVGALRPHVAKAFEIRGGKADGEQPQRELDGRGYRVPNGGLFSTVEDLAKFVAWQLGESSVRLLKPEAQEDNYARVNSASGELRSGYGIGFQVSRRGDVVAYGHGGSTSGYRAAVLFDRRSKTGVIVLASVAGGAVNVSELAITALQKLAAARAVPAVASEAMAR
jgi:CubicO group peptidase (beta-lactamase class C family)